MPGDPAAQDGYVAYEQGQRPVLYDPAEAEALALSLLGAASEARAHRLAQESDGESDETAVHGREEPSPQRIV